MKITKIITIILLCIILIMGLPINNFAVDVESNEITDNPNNNQDNNTDTENNNNNDNDSDDNKDTEDNKQNNDDNKTQNENPKKEQNNKPVSSTNNNSGSNSNSNNKSKSNTNNNKSNTNENNGDKKEEEKSNNNNLKSLDVDVEGLSPEFNKDVTEYYLIVDLSVEEIDVKAVAEDEKSNVSISGNKDLEEGENIIKIVVTAEAGNKKTYNINVTKTDDIESVNATLKSLSVNGYNFYPDFRSNIYNYNLLINEAVSKLDVIAETQIEDATYEIIGNDNLVSGDNVIKIIVTAKDGETKREYKLNVYISSQDVQAQKINKTPAIIMLTVLGVGIAVIIVIILKKRNIIK